MRRIMTILGASVLLSLAPLFVSAQENIQTIEIGMLSTTHVIFASDLTYVDVSSLETIGARVVDASKNILAMKARKEFDFTATISALEANGTMHTFYVRYDSTPKSLLIDTRTVMQAGVAQVNAQIRPDNSAAEAAQLAEAMRVASSAPGTYVPAQGSAPAQDPRKESGSRRRARGSSRQEQPAARPAVPAAGVNVGGGVTVTGEQTSNFGRVNAPTLEEVMRKEREIFHVTDKLYHLEADCVNVFAYSDVTYIIISMENRSDIGYEAGDAQFTVENKKISSKTLSTDKSIWPKSSYGSLSCAPNSRTLIGYTIPKLTLQKNEILKIYIYEKGGTRNLFLSLDDKDINYAVSPI